MCRRETGEKASSHVGTRYGKGMEHQGHYTVYIQ